MLQFNDFRLHLIRECEFRLDGGAMFGVVPKTLWEKESPADEHNRIIMACNLLLIETKQGLVLVETGMGSRWSEKERARYGLKTLVDHDQLVQSAGFRNEDVQTVILSHLHFDHAGGAVIQKDGHLLPTFPQAKYYAQKGEWEFSQNANARARASYRKDDLLPLMQAGVLELVDGNAEILPGIELKVTGGHTSHHQIVTFHSGNKSGVYFADIIPTKSHLTPPWVMGYDHYPLESCDVKSEWLSKAAAENWLVVFDHEFGIPWGHVKCSAAGKFSFEALPESSPQELSANALCN